MTKTLIATALRCGSTFFINTLKHHEYSKKIYVDYDVLNPGHLNRNISELKTQLEVCGINKDISYLYNLRFNDEREFFFNVIDLYTLIAKGKNLSNISFRISPNNLNTPKALNSLTNELETINNHVTYTDIVSAIDNAIIIDRNNCEMMYSVAQVFSNSKWGTPFRFEKNSNLVATEQICQQTIYVTKNKQLFFEELRNVMSQNNKKVFNAHYDDFSSKTFWKDLSDFLQIAISPPRNFLKVAYDYQAFFDANIDILREFAAPWLLEAGKDGAKIKLYDSTNARTFTFAQVHKYIDPLGYNRNYSFLPLC